MKIVLKIPQSKISLGNRRELGIKPFGTVATESKYMFSLQGKYNGIENRTVQNFNRKPSKVLVSNRLTDF